MHNAHKPLNNRLHMNAYLHVMRIMISSDIIVQTTIMSFFVTTLCYDDSAWLASQPYFV